MTQTLQETEKGIEPPRWYLIEEGDFTVKSRYATSVVRNKSEDSGLPFAFWNGHKESHDGEPQNPELEANIVVISKHGTTMEEKYEVEADE